MTYVIETRGLTKHYGDLEALLELDLTVAKGEIVGFLGPNGAGKTTTIRLLLDLIRPTSGSARVLGLDTRTDSVAIRHRVGYLPGELAMYDAMTGIEMLSFFARIRSLDGTGRAHEVADRLELDLERKVGAYSSGNPTETGSGRRDDARSGAADPRRAHQRTGSPHPAAVLRDARRPA